MVIIIYHVIWYITWLDIVSGSGPVTVWSYIMPHGPFPVCTACLLCRGRRTNDYSTGLLSEIKSCFPIKVDTDCLILWKMFSFSRASSPKVITFSFSSKHGTHHPKLPCEGQANVPYDMTEILSCLTPFPEILVPLFKEIRLSFAFLKKYRMPLYQVA